MAALAEYLKEVVELQGTNRRDFQLKKRCLAWVGIDRMHTLRCQQRVIQHVTARAGNDHHDVFGRQIERLPVNRGVFPARVIDERSGVERLEETLV